MINNNQTKTTTDELEKSQLSNIVYQDFKFGLVKISDGLFNCPLTLFDGKIMNIPMRDDGYINVTLLCKASGKDIREWKKNKLSKELLNNLSSMMGIPIIDILKSNKGGDLKLQGTFAHPDIAIQIAQWCNSSFALQVSRWTRELLLFGKVNLGQEKSNEELENKFHKQIHNLELQLTQSNKEKNKYLSLYNTQVQKHRFHKFNVSGPCFYIITQGLDYADGIARVKIGICGCIKRKINKCPHCEGVLEDNKKTMSFDWRLGDHRTLWPQLHVKFAVYTEDAELLERNMKRLYRTQINPSGHEIIEGVRLDEVIDQTKSFLKLFNYYSGEKQEYMIEDNIEKYNKNSLTHMKKFIKDVIDEKEDKVKEIKNEIEEKENTVKDIKNDIEEYRKYLTKIEEYKDVELGNLLSMFNLPKAGLKKIKYDRLMKFLEEKITEYESNKEITKESEEESDYIELPIRKCKMCKEEKLLNSDNFQPFATMGFKHECRECVVNRYSKVVEKEFREKIRTKIDENIGTKKCFRCMEIISKIDFCKSNKTKDGLNSICKNCDHIRKYGEKATRLIKQQPKNIPDTSKWCPKCETVKLKTEYYKADNRPDGLQHSCKLCNNKTRVANTVLKNAK